ncbi:MAG: hypothetical protein Q7T62_12085 [Undibacterium sp.]|nr:hypothetical protein [Undibacterium sp.]
MITLDDSKWVKLAMIEFPLGSETDDELFRRLKAEVLAMGGTIREKDWAVGGSQEVITYAISLPQGEIEAISETYVGLSLRGEESVVSILLQRVLPNQANTQLTRTRKSALVIFDR